MRILFIIAVLFTLPAFGQSSEYKKMLKKYYSDFPTISINDAYNKMGNDNVFFLDTREQKEFDVSHIKNAKCVGYDHFDISSVSSIPKDAEIIVYCSIGARSQTIGEKLKSAGYSNVKNLYGGMFHWANRKYPMVDNDNKRTTNIHGFSKEWGRWVTKGTVVY